VERWAPLGAEGISAGVPDRPEPEGEVILWLGDEGISHGPPVVAAPGALVVKQRHALSQAGVDDSVIRPKRPLEVGKGIHASSRCQLLPTGDPPGRRGSTVIRWGVIGPGIIATGFAEAMHWVEGGAITAVASRSAE